MSRKEKKLALAFSLVTLIDAVLYVSIYDARIYSGQPLRKGKYGMWIEGVE